MGTDKVRMKEGWTYKKLGEVAHYPTNRVSSLLMNETNYVGVDNLVKDRGGKTLANYVPSEGNAVEFIKGDILLGNIRPYLKKIWLSDIDGGASGDVLIIRPNDTRQIWSNYLYWALASDHFFEYDTIHCKGAKMPRGNKVDIMNYLLPIPSVEIQQQIVSELDLLSGVIEKQKAQIEELEKLAQSIFYDMFGDPVTNDKGWKMQKLGNVCKTSSGGTPSSSRKEYYEGGTIPWLRSGEVSQGFIYSTELYITDEGMNNSSAKLFPIDTVAIAMYGATVGQVGVLKNEMTTNQAICGIFPNDYYSPIFLLYFLRGMKPVYLKDAAGGAQPNISQGVIKNTNVPIIPFYLQQVFAAKIEAIESMKAKVRQSLKESEQLFNSRMDYYFN